MSDASSEAAPRDRGPGPRFIIIGAGMSGILSAIKLREAGYENFVVYEKGNGIGGTWRENTYPGIACDVPSHFYSYSFALNPDWSHRFSPGPEIRTYFENVAERYGVTSKVCFEQEIDRAVFEDGRWKIETKRGVKDEADYIIAATGVLHHPSIPDLDGLDDFEGACFHSARWDHAAQVDGARVGVIGTGSSAIQIVGAVVDRAAELTLFQRTAQWITPIENPPFSEKERERFHVDPASMSNIRTELARAFTEGFANVLVDAESPMLKLIHDNCVRNLEDHVKDPVLREKLRPDYRATCKRLVLSGDFYDAIQKPNAKLVTEQIDRVEQKGIRCSDGALHELDVLVLATGFRVDHFVRPMDVRGQGGIPLDDIWKRGPSAYQAISVPGLPNFFMLNGPTSPVGNFSLIEVAELQVAYILQLIDRVESSSARGISATRAALDRYDADRIEAAKSTIWASGCKSWYLDESGVPTAWPWTFDRFREEMKAPRLDDYELS